VVRLGCGFQPKESGHCLHWTQEVPEARIGVEVAGSIEAAAVSAPLLCRGASFGPSLRRIGTRSRHHSWGFTDPEGLCRHADASGQVSGSVLFASPADVCDVWWREVSEDVIPPTPELTMPLWEDGEALTTEAGDKLGLCRIVGTGEDGRPLLGTIVLEGPDMGICHFVTPSGEAKELVGGLFHVLQARPSGVAPKCAEGAVPADLLWRVERFLTAADRALLTRVVQDAGTAEGDVFAQLVEGLQKLGGCELNEVLSASRFVPHPLNALGLHLLRSLLAERMADARARDRGYDKHPDYPTWSRQGLLMKDLDDPKLGGDKGVQQLLRMVSGEESEGIPELPLRWQARNVTVQETPDPQSQLHIDTFAPIVKVWVFQDPPGVSLEEGPLLFSQRSHRNSEAKLRWMHAYAQEPASEARAEPSFRLRGCAAAAKAAADFVQAVEGHLVLEAAAAAQPVLPLPGVRRTLVLADTSALHARGTGVPGRVRSSWRQAGDNDGGLKRLNPYRWTEAKPEL
ncbi:unnamed protein product, partial [Symbiodinium sp. CCMP2592]